MTSALGHNLTYASRVLAAAKQCGFSVVAGVNRAGADQGLDGRTLALFSRDVWANNPVEGRRWHAQAALERALRRRSGPIAAAAAETTSEGRGPSAAPLRGWRLQRLADGLREDVAALLAARRAARNFADEIERFLTEAGLQPGDIVYMPTVLSTELRALDRLLDRSEPARRFKWRVMLRYAPHARSVRGAIRTAARRLHRRRDADVALFSDTEQLCAMYERLCHTPFGLLPIPIDAPDRPRSRRDGPLLVGYFGDARDEKGFDLLPQIIASVRRRRAELTIRFVVQINLNTTEGDPGARAARSQLSSMRGADLELVEGPLTVQAYRDLMTQADIVLLPYRPSAYAERSSGILMEAIVAGAPCVATRGAWMQSALDSAAPDVPAGVLAEPDAEALADGVLQVAADWARYASGAWKLGQTLRSRCDPAELVRRLAGLC